MQMPELMEAITVEEEMPAGDIESYKAPPRRQWQVEKPPSAMPETPISQSVHRVVQLDRSL